MLPGEFAGDNHYAYKPGLVPAQKNSPREACPARALCGGLAWPGACLLGGSRLRGMCRRCLFSRLFIRQVTSDDTAADSANYRVMAGIVAGHAAYRGAFQATLGAGAASGASQCNCA